MQYDEIYARAMKTLTESGLSERWLNLGCETGSQNRINREYMDGYVFSTSLIDSVHADTTTSLFGVPLSSPIIGSALSRGRVLENIKHDSTPWFETPPYIMQTSRALSRCGSMMGLGICEMGELQAVGEHGRPFYHIVKPYPDEELIASHILAAESNGAVAVGMDITPSFGHKAWDEDASLDTGVAPKSMKQLRSYVDMTSLPFIVKGVLGEQDAERAVEIGAAAIVISNHGGECIDYSRPVLHVLESVRKLSPDISIIVDSGFRRGSDVLKALCLGADAVAMATPFVVGYAASGELGVEAMYRAIQAELRRTMSVCGFATVRSIDSSMIVRLD